MIADIEEQEKRIAPRVLRKAVNNTLKALHSQAVREIQHDTGLPQKLVRLRTKLYRLRARRRGGGRLWWGGYGFPMSQISSRQKYSRDTVRAGRVTVSERGLFRAVVRAADTSKHVGPYVRKPEAAKATGQVRRARKRKGGRVSVGVWTRRGRLPIREVKYHPSLVGGRVFMRLRGFAARLFERDLADALEAELRRR